jgi:membrane protein implicated in regulation of membrane protease activity
MAGRFGRFLHDGAASPAANWVAGVLALVSAAGTLGSIVLWIEIGLVGAAIAFATTIALIYVAVLFLIARMVPRRDGDEHARERASTRDAKRAVSQR